MIKFETQFSIFRDSVYVTFGLKESEFVYLGPRIFQKNENGIIQFNVGPSAGLGLNVMTVVRKSKSSQENCKKVQNISFLAIFFFGIKCYFCIQNMVKQSASSKSNALQRQLFYALVIQTLIPVIFMQLPFTIVLILCIFDINDDVISGLAVMSIAVYPAIDPLPNIFIIKDYRRALLSEFDTFYHFYTLIFFNFESSKKSVHTNFINNFFSNF